ncbi:MAG: DUF1800 domain-containing protein [Planctomycetes bacterium]|nr:DUF1800 domain-containing protein [Planctomycetota bacterium]
MTRLFMFRSPGMLACLAFCFLLFSSAAPGNDLKRTGHVLNRLAYGPSPEDLQRIQDTGIAHYIQGQLAFETLDESDNQALHTREAALFGEVIPATEKHLINVGALWRYFKGTEEPPTGWRLTNFDDEAWLAGPTGIGYGDKDDETVLTDMRRTSSQAGYISLYARHTFVLTDESRQAVSDLLLRVDFDDGFQAALNGVAVARKNLPDRQVAYDQKAQASHEAGTPETFNLTPYKALLQTGTNVLTVQVHNRSITSSDLSLIPELISRTRLPGPSLVTINGIDELQQLVHIRGVYARRQLQAVLAEFWENHFTTDYDKLADYFDELQNSDGSDAMSRDQARAEAAQVEYREYEFFHDRALGHFGDLLLYSATSPSMLVYLDNVLNVKAAPNENYAREILELSAFGVDNRYTQGDLEELARCFTGWTTVKLRPDQVSNFPTFALAPPTESGVQTDDEVLIDLGDSWRYFKGQSEPTPAWATRAFSARDWLAGPTGLGYGDGDDATVLSDMRHNYTSVYLRRTFQIDDPAQITGLVLEVAYDDGFVAFLNGQEVARSSNMEGRGTPPPYDQTASPNHEVTDGVELFSLMPYRHLLLPQENILALQIHNGTKGSSDLSVLPRLINRRILPGSTESGDRYGIWTFRFDPAQHDTAAKVLYPDTPYELAMPAGRTGANGVRDALDAIEAMAGHPSTAEYICIKLIQRFVSDQISLARVKAGAVSPELGTLLNDAVEAWQSTDPPGHVATVLETILDPQNQENLFWSNSTHRNKVKTPVEYINSSLRALAADASGIGLPGLNRDMGMHLFTRDDPDGYSELGSDWMDTASMLERIEFVRTLASNTETKFSWDSLALLESGLASSDLIVAYFDAVLFQGTLTQTDKTLILAYLNTDKNGQWQPLDATRPTAFQERIQAATGYILSLPQWHFQ